MKKMKKLKNISRAKRIIKETIDSLSLNLRGMTVLTEAGSGAFVLTPIIATVANADKVYVVVKDSVYGKREDIIRYLYDLVTSFNFNSNAIVVIDNPEQIANEVNIVTNLGFVRPITENLISKLPKDSAIPLMWETWEKRACDIDFAACKKHSIPVLGTCETDVRLMIFKYVGLLALKLLFEVEIEVFGSKILIVSSGVFLSEIKKVLSDNGANLYTYNPFESKDSDELKEYLKITDAVVVAEQICTDVLISDADGHISTADLSGSCPEIVHISGIIDYEAIDKAMLCIHPQKRVEHGYMTVTTDHVGMAPVIKLHAAGLKVGQALVEGLRKNYNIYDAKAYALSSSPAVDFY